MDDIAKSITTEHGKTFADAKGDVLRGLQVVEYACGIPSLLLGDKLEVAKDMDTYTIREPLGVVGGIMVRYSLYLVPLFNHILTYYYYYYYYQLSPTTSPP